MAPLGLFLPHILIETIEWNLELLPIATDVGVIRESIRSIYYNIYIRFKLLWRVSMLFTAYCDLRVLYHFLLPQIYVSQILPTITINININWQELKSYNSLQLLWLMCQCRLALIRIKTIVIRLLRKRNSGFTNNHKQCWSNLRCWIPVRFGTTIHCLVWNVRNYTLQWPFVDTGRILDWNITFFTEY